MPDNNFLIFLLPLKYFIKIKYYMKMSVKRNHQNFTNRTVKHLAGCFSVVCRRLVMPFLGKGRSAVKYRELFIQLHNLPQLNY
jgi:hypothetical protein